MLEQLTLFLLAFLVITAPAWSGPVRKYAKAGKINPGQISILMATCAGISVLAYVGLVRFTLIALATYFDISWLEFLEGVVTGKGLIIFSVFVLTMYCGWYFILYPLVRDFEQIRQESTQRLQRKQKP